jgi:glucose-6-phosphate 1-dehydrogenase
VVLDAIQGKPALFWRSDSIERAWEFVDPMLKAEERLKPEAFPNYDPGEDGPAAAMRLIKDDRRTWLKQNH